MKSARGVEFRKCPECDYNLGFHSSFLKQEEDYSVILICHECGARYDIREIELSRSEIDNFDKRIL